MQGRSILVLVLVAVVLGAFVWMQQDEAAENPTGLGDRMLFDGVEPDRVGTIAIDHGERHWQVRMERDARGVWYLTDPIAYLASEAPVKQILDVARQSRATVVRDVSDLAKLGLDPPRATVTMTERAEAAGADATTGPGAQSGAAARSVTVELGLVDVDGTGMYVRIGDDVLRTKRTLDNALYMSEEDYRSRRLVDISLTERVIEFSRTGQLEPDGANLDIAALVDAGGWRLATPARGTLDPLTAHIFLQQLLSARCSGFASDDPGPLSEYGLDEPALRVSLSTARGIDVALRFAPMPDTDGERWYCVREEFPYVWEVRRSDVEFLATPYEDLLDYRIVRAKRDSITDIRMRGADGAKRVYKKATHWRVSRDVESEDPEDFLVADSGRIEDILARLESAELGSYLPIGTALVPSTPPRTLYLETEHGEVFGGEIGEPYTVQGTESGRMFRRDRDELVALVSEELAALVEVDPEELRTLVVHRLVEREQRAVRLSCGGRTLAYALDQRANVWQTEGTSLEARAFAALADRFLSIRARRWLSDAEASAAEVVEAASELQEPIEVEIESVDGARVAFRLRPGPNGSELCEADGSVAEIRPGLLEAARGLFGE